VIETVGSIVRLPIQNCRVKPPDWYPTVSTVLPETVGTVGWLSGESSDSSSNSRSRIPQFEEGNCRVVG
jgi:hypothetical protein